MTEFQVQRDELTTTRLVDAGGTGDNTPLGENEILAKIDRFALTANNITYGVVGDRLGYWQFFPPAGNEAEGWGLIPVWGFADVVRSNVAEIPVGERLFGYFPPASHLTLAPTRIRPENFFDGTAHRAELPAAYNLYRRVNAEPNYDRATDAERMLFFPLHVTSFCLWDALKMNEWYGARQVILASASSKTSIGLAYGLDADDDAPPAIAITSERNREFVEQLDVYTSVVTYDDISSIDATVTSVVVDMAGNDRTLKQLNDHVGENLQMCIRVGVTHRDAAGGDTKLERSTWFFAPGHIEKRMKEWGPDGFTAKSIAFMQATAARSRGWLKVTPIEGLQGMQEIFADVANGRIAADAGLIVEL
jgi:hypothetical protein